MYLRMLCLLILAAAALSARAIGNRTHAEISERAADRYCMGPRAMLPGLSDFMTSIPVRKALFSGSTFPDWGYGGIDQEAAEQVHWVPFHKTFFDVLHERLSATWSEEEQKNVAFFLGDVSHSVADIPWHFNDPANRSFISASGDADHSTHLDCDNGSDIFLLQHEHVSPEIGFGDYYWPVELINAAYKRAGRTLSDGIIKTGGTRQQGYWLIAQTVSDAQIANYTATRKWIGANYESYYYGGIDHDAAAVAIWFKYYFARFRGDFFYQNMPFYGPKPPNWDAYYGCSDTVLYPGVPGQNAGGEPILALTYGQEHSVLLLQYDLADISADAPLDIATLWLADAGADGAALAAHDVEIAALPAAWEEGDANSNKVTGTHGLAGASGATWANTQVNGFAWSPAKLRPAAPGWYTLDISAQVKAWAAAPGTNHGLALRLAGSEQAPLQLYSSEAWKSQEGPSGGERVALRPALVVTTRH